MAGRFTYSRWDGTQQGFDLDNTSLFEEMSDDLLAYGDLRGALRRLMNRGLTDPNGERLMGLQEMRKRLKERRQELLDRGDLGGVYKEIADELNDIVDEERHAIDQSVRDANKSSDTRRQESAQRSAEDRNFRLDMLPEDLAGKVRELSAYDFESKEAEQRFEQLKDKLRNQLAQQMVDQMSSAIQNMTPQDMQRMKEMMTALNEMIDKHQRGEDPGFEDFMKEYGDFFPENPQTIEELLEQIAQRMAAAQAMLNSMTPEQRAQLEELSQQLMQDMDLQQQMGQLSANMQSMFPSLPWEQGYEMQGQDPMGFEQAMQTMRDLGDLDQLEDLLRNPSTPQQLAEADMDRVRDLMGDDVANAMDKLSKLVQELEREGLIRQKEGKLEVTPKGMRQIGSKALRDMFSRLAKDKLGQHQISPVGQGHERTYDTKPYEYGDPFNLDLQRTIRNALNRGGQGTPVRLSPDDFEIERTEHLTRSATVLMLDASYSMYRDDRWGPAKKVAVALQSLISSQYPRDYLGILMFGHVAWEIKADELVEATIPGMQGTNMHHALGLARKMLARQHGNKQIIMITDGEPTAHITPYGEAWFTYFDGYEAQQLTVEATLREAVRCSKENIRINTFMLDADVYLRRFVEQMSSLNGGRAFLTSSDNLGDYLLVDFLEHKKKVSRGGRARRAS
ncbi:MAG: VWA domain-containing protein [Actinomycetota bacterium]|nr:VWA domain-containing protein [Actinomycetota bacterium]MDA3001904.1 VWA domain-containing protein [Actinomycetota bacterium]